MRFLFVHSWGAFSLAEWCLREALAADCSETVAVRSLHLPADEVPPSDQLARVVAAWRPDVVGFSCHYWSLAKILDAAAAVQDLRPGTQVLLGGPEVSSTYTAAFLLEHHPAVDLVIRGAGEGPLCRLLETLAGRGSLHDVPALSFRGGDGVVHNGPPPRAPWRRGPIFHAGNGDLARRLDGLSTVSYETLRGCHERCAYCLYPAPGLSLLDDELVEAELRWLLGFEIPHVRITDAHFAGRPGRAKKLLRILEKINRRSSLKIYPDLRHLDEEYLDLVEQAGAEITSLGVQTTNPVALRTIRRSATHEQRAAISAVLRRRPRTPADVIVGLPGDDPAGLQATFRDVLRLGFAAINVFRLRIFPGTPLAADPAGFLGDGPVGLTPTGQVLFSPAFPRESQARVASLVHALELVAPLLRTRRLFGPDGGPRALDVADHPDPETLAELAAIVASRRPGLVLERLADVAGALAAVPGAPEPAALRDAVALDLLEHLGLEGPAAGRPDFVWHHGTPRRVSRVAVALSAGGHAVWDLRARTVTPPGPGRPPLDPTHPDTLVLDPAPDATGEPGGGG